MATFIPTPFTTPNVAPNAVAGDAFRRIPYISVSEYRFAPTAIDTTNMVPGTTVPANSTASLAETILRASAWLDQFVFHRGDGTIAASVTTEWDWITVKPDGSLSLICNFKPVLQVIGVGLGPTPSQQSSLDSTTAGDIAIDGKIIELPGTWCWSGPVPSFRGFPSYNGQAYVTWQYVNGYPHMALAANANAGATSITVTPAVPSAFPYGVYANTPLTIRDGQNTEVVQISTTPTSNTLQLVSPLQFTHVLPGTPDSILVSSVPWQIEQATILLTSCLIKTRGSRAFVMSDSPGGKPSRKAMGEAGALADYDMALTMLKPFQTVFLHS